jgi:hypothetical protein
MSETLSSNEMRMVTTSLYSSNLGSDGEETVTLILGRRYTNRETERDNLSDSVWVVITPAADVRCPELTYTLGWHNRTVQN